MNKHKLDINLEDALEQYFDAPSPRGEFLVKLEQSLLADTTIVPHHSFSFSNSKRSLMQTLRARPVLAFLAAILALIMLTGMAYAVGRLTGFIPGFGFTSNTGTVFILAEPVESSQAGITLRIDNAVSDDTRFWAAFTVKGLTGRETNPQVFVLLPDGKKVQMTVGGMASSPHGETQISYTFPALPSGTQSLTILIENLEGQNYPLALRLRPVKSDEIIPVQPTGTEPKPSEALNGLRLVLENIAPAIDKTVFQVSLQFDRPDIGIGASWSITLTDEEGRVYPVKDITPLSRTDGNTRIYETVPFRGNERLTVSLVTFPDGEALPVIEDFSVDLPGFRFDPGPTPQVGQTWTLNEMVNLGSFKLHVVGAKLTAESGLVFEFEAAGNVTGVMLYTNDPRLRGSTGGVPVQNKNFTSSMKFESIPTQPFDVHIRSVYFTIHGPWKIKWQPPAAPTPDASVPLPTEIPTLPPQATPSVPTRMVPPTATSQWMYFPPTSLAAGQGKLAMMANVNGLSQVFVLSSDGSDWRMVSDGVHAANWPSLSPDGRRVAYAVNYDGNGYDFDIVVVDIVDGEVHRLTSDTFDEQHPIWSPDGSQIAFESDRDRSAIGVMDIFVMNADGSKARRVLGTTGAGSLNGWSVDGKEIYYTSLQSAIGQNQTNEILAAGNLVSGQTHTILSLPQRARGGTQAAVSPDGQQVAYVKDTETGSVIMLLGNGMERQFSDGQGEAFLPVWSPDGKWLAYSNLVGGVTVPIFIQVAGGAEVVRTPGVDGQITSWVAAN